MLFFLALFILITLPIALYQRSLLSSIESESYLIYVFAIILSGFITISNLLFNELVKRLGVFYRLERRTHYNIEVAKGISAA